MEKDYVNMREFKKVFMVTLVEGKGIQENPSRLVRYFYDENTEYIGKLDHLHD